MTPSSNRMSIRSPLYNRPDRICRTATSGPQRTGTATEGGTKALPDLRSRPADNKKRHISAIKKIPRFIAPLFSDEKARPSAKVSPFWPFEIAAGPGSFLRFPFKRFRRLRARSETVASTFRHARASGHPLDSGSSRKGRIGVEERGRFFLDKVYHL